jgi:hypothetical protein
LLSNKSTRGMKRRSKTCTVCDYCGSSATRKTLPVRLFPPNPTSEEHCWVSDGSDEEPDNALYADHRNIYKVEKWKKRMA